jgi:hypothetical protein
LYGEFPQDKWFAVVGSFDEHSELIAFISLGPGIERIIGILSESDFEEWRTTAVIVAAATANTTERRASGKQARCKEQELPRDACSDEGGDTIWNHIDILDMS